MIKGILPLLLLLGCANSLYAQRGRYVDPRIDRNGVPRWDDRGAFNKDVFTFVRIRYSSYYGGFTQKWATDYPDSDLNFSFRLQQLTSMEVDPDGR